MKLKNKSMDNIIAGNLMVADSFLKRLKGLMFTKEFSSDSALYIYPCNAIHTFFMNYNIDVLYLDKNNMVVGVDEDLKPGRIGKYVKNAVAVVEFTSGEIKKNQIQIGHALELL